jgi:adenosylcobyric acid synthase
MEYARFDMRQGKKRSRTLMIQGTSSGAGKSLLVTALCRIFNNKGLRVAPFKAQNMALNSFITRDGGEIGRAQALQAEAARIEPTVDMNPVLLKAMGEKGSQVIVHGKVYGNFSARDYYKLKKALWPKITESLDRLMSEYDLVIIEGAGSPAEINLRDKEIVNMTVARYAKAPVLLVGDIDRGGVFASLYGTLKLLGRDSRFIKGFVINKFRGDIEILRPGLELIKEKTGRPVIGVLPYMETGLPEEDGLSLRPIEQQSSRAAETEQQSSRAADQQDIEEEIIPLKNYCSTGLLVCCSPIKIVILRLNYISNFTDFDPFLYEPDVELLYSNSPADIENADIVIVPGTKNTVKDLLYLKEKGLDKSLWRAYSKGVEIIGICGGYQILGRKLFDPYCVESECKEIDGIGLLNIETTFQKEKVTAQVTAEPLHTFPTSQVLKGYEIHMGVSSGDIGLFKIRRYIDKDISANTPVPGGEVTVPGGEVTVEALDGSINGNCWGTYIHGIFENDLFRRNLVDRVRVRKGLEPLLGRGGLNSGENNSSTVTFATKWLINYREIKERAIDYLAEVFEKHLDMSYIWRLIS